MKRRRNVPELTARIMANADFLNEAIMEMLRGSGQLAKLSAQIRRAQRRLRRSVDEETWQGYLGIEELENLRSSAMIELLVRWAFREGARSGGRRHR